MKTSKRIEITIRTDRRLVIRGSIGTRSWCPECGIESETVSLETAGVVAEAIEVGVEDRWLSGDLHMLPAGDGTSRVCLRSFFEVARKEGKSSGSGRANGLAKTE